MNRFALAFAVAFSLSIFSFTTEAQESLRAQEVWFGHYTSGELKSIDDPNSPTGKHHFSSNTRGPAQNLDRIAIKPDGLTSFGFGYQLTGVPKGTRVRTIHIIRFPGKGVPGRDGRLQETSTLPGEDVVGDEAHIGWRMNGKEPKEYEGVWTFQVWSEQRLLLERRFTVYR
ncbi:MAG: hypothetical protein K2P86_04975 [Xanthobacteraceae bacterium]|jgi:hypothetical protein|nr:hypothetical protein [Xanthobacteraceae bacterium]